MCCCQTADPSCANLRPRAVAAAVHPSRFSDTSDTYRPKFQSCKAVVVKNQVNLSELRGSTAVDDVYCSLVSLFATLSTQVLLIFLFV